MNPVEILADETCVRFFCGEQKTSSRTRTTGRHHSVLWSVKLNYYLMKSIDLVSGGAIKLAPQLPGAPFRPFVGLSSRHHSQDASRFLTTVSNSCP